MGLVDQYTPYGSLTSEVSGYESYTDPYTGQTYEIPRYTQTTTLSPEQQALLDQNNQTQLGLSQLAGNQTEFLKDYMSTPFQGDTAAIEGRLDELMRLRADPRFARDEETLRTRLTNQGLAPGSEAWNREMEMFNNAKNDAYNQMYLQGRGQALGELQAMRNQPINEITALLSGSQVSNPNVRAAQPGGAATTDVAGIINQNYNQQMANYQQQMANYNGMMGGLFGLGANALMFSDKRLKEDIKKVGKLDNGLDVHAYRYKAGGPVHIGLMAQEVEKKNPDAVQTLNGFKAVDYKKAVS